MNNELIQLVIVIDYNLGLHVKVWCDLKRIFDYTAVAKRVITDRAVPCYRGSFYCLLFFLFVLCVQFYNNNRPNRNRHNHGGHNRV